MNEPISDQNGKPIAGDVNAQRVPPGMPEWMKDLKEFTVHLAVTNKTVSFLLRALNIESATETVQFIMTTAAPRIAGYEIHSQDGQVLRAVYPFPVYKAIGKTINDAANTLVVPCMEVNPKMLDQLKGKGFKKV